MSTDRDILEQMIDRLARELETVRFHLYRDDFQGNQRLVNQALDSIDKTQSLLVRPESSKGRWRVA